MSELYDIVPLSTVVKINSGIALPKIFKDIEKSNGEYSFFKVAQMNNDIKVMKDAELRFTEEESKKFKIKLFPKGSVLIPKRGGAILTNKKRLLTEIASYDSNIMGLKANNEILTDEFLMVYMDSINLSDYIDTSTIPQINNKHIDLMKIPLPPLQEQKRIVAKLDSLFAKIDQAIALHQQNIDEADAFIGSVLNGVFGELEGRYGKKPLGELTKTTSGGTPRRNEKSYWGGTIGWLKSGELNNGYVTEVQEFITEEGLQKSSAKLFPKGTLLIAMYGATVGKLAILDIETSTNQAICGILNDKQLFETKYMFYFFQKSKEKMLLDSTGGAQPNISQTYLKELQVIFPPLKTQQKTIKYLDQLSQKTQALKKAQQEEMQSLKDLKASLLDRAFRGEI